ncbi:MAG TPA: HAMP domain-containing sensor histidine kinase [Geminicoccaceae bacterium]|nr:HAMP domain-containing sensor histidine kinase [Geminicoccus sp.]HMU50957.1 HAMP domain-containing sensor histidine kinase [Geminicoccaceae bacterium]
MPSTRLLRSSSFRLTLLYLGLFVLSALSLLAFVYGSSIRFMERQTVETIEVELAGLLEQYQARGFMGLARSVAARSAQEPMLDSFYLLLDADGREVAGTFVGFTHDLPQGDQPLRTTLPEWTEDGKKTERPFLLVRRNLLRGGALILGRDITDKLHIQARLLTAIALGGVLMVVLGIGGGVLMSRWMLGRIEAVNRTTQQIMAGDLGQRIEIEGSGDEFDGLAGNLNAMLERIERLLKGMRQVTDNVAHDLRTPLNRIRSRLEVALMAPLDAAENREVLEQTLRDADGLIATFNALLSIARIEAGTPQSEWEAVDLSGLAADVVELYEPLAEEKAIELRLEAPEPVTTVGNRQLIAQAVANVVDNAIKYSPDHSRVVVCTRNGAESVVEVADSGPGIPQELREQALERFVRLDAERTTPGNGLGLSLVSAVAKLHDAHLHLDDNAPGLKVTMAFHAPPPSA